MDNIEHKSHLYLTQIYKSKACLLLSCLLPYWPNHKAFCVWQNDHWTCRNGSKEASRSLTWELLLWKWGEGSNSCSKGRWWRSGFFFIEDSGRTLIWLKHQDDFCHLPFSDSPPVCYWMENWLFNKIFNLKHIKASYLNSNILILRVGKSNL